MKSIREGLIQLRTEIIEGARREFSARMTDVWQALRRDTASTFSRLYIPEVKGKGYKLEMEVKAHTKRQPALPCHTPTQYSARNGLRLPRS